MPALPRALLVCGVFRTLRLAGGPAGAPFILSTGSPLPSNIAPEAVDAFVRAARQGA